MVLRECSVYVDVEEELWGLQLRKGLNNKCGGTEDDGELGRNREAKWKGFLQHKSRSSNRNFNSLR